MDDLTWKKMKDTSTVCGCREESGKAVFNIMHVTAIAALTVAWCVYFSVTGLLPGLEKTLTQEIWLTKLVLSDVDPQ